MMLTISFWNKLIHLLFTLKQKNLHTALTEKDQETLGADQFKSKISVTGYDLHTIYAKAMFCCMVALLA
jgi:hypothetical protein